MTTHNEVEKWEEEFDERFNLYKEPEKYLTNMEIENCKLKAHKFFIQTLLTTQKEQMKRAVEEYFEERESDLKEEIYKQTVNSGYPATHTETRMYEARKNRDDIVTLIEKS